MSLRGIDAQIMFARTIEYQRPTAAEQQHAALMSDIQGVEGDVRAQHKSESVAATDESDQVLLHPDGEGGAAYDYYASGGSEPGEDGDGDSRGSELSDPSGEGRVIDITV
ncbi:MAG: hypothetical protein LBL25_01065 [Oscillospiraceae bacterium]|nr:hypothetical protein [Oscillospiraceae bacterium]